MTEVDMGCVCQPAPEHRRWTPPCPHHQSTDWQQWAAINTPHYAATGRVPDWATNRNAEEIPELAGLLDKLTPPAREWFGVWWAESVREGRPALRPVLAEMVYRLTAEPEVWAPRIERDTLREAYSHLHIPDGEHITEEDLEMPYLVEPTNSAGFRPIIPNRTTYDRNSELYGLLVTGHQLLTAARAVATGLISDSPAAEQRLARAAQSLPAWPDDLLHTIEEGLDNLVAGSAAAADHDNVCAVEHGLRVV